MSAPHHAGFLIERMQEPPPEEGLKADKEMYDNIMHQPWILFVRAIRR